MNTESIRFRLIGWYAVLALAAFSLFGAYTYGAMRHYLRTARMETLSKRAERIGETLLTQIDKTGEAYVITEVRARFSPEADDRFIRILRGDGSVLYISGDPTTFDFDPRQIPPPRLDLKSVAYREQSFPSGFRLSIVAIPFQAGTHHYIIEAGNSAMAGDEVLRGLLQTLGFGLPLLLLMAIGGGYLLIGRSLAPVDTVIGAAEKITFHNLGQRLPVMKSGRELENLTLALNRMIGRLQESFEHAKRFSADASHELRTPLTIMRGELEALLQRPSFDEESREKIASILEEAERLTQIVEGLFAIYRLEAGEATLEISRFDFADLVISTAEQMSLLAQEKWIDLQCRTEGCVEVNGDRMRLKQVVVNLLDNAIKYTPKGGAIVLSVGIEKDQAVFKVADNGDGIPPEAMPHLFDRFFRAGEARSIYNGGAGLGLAIVRSICLAHRGDITAANLPERGALFTVLLPLAKRRSGPGVLSLFL